MNPGIELDVLVAEKVMGLKVVKNKSGSKLGGYYYTIGEPNWFDIQGDMQLSNPVPPYSEDIAAAWQVVEKLRGFSRLYDFDLYGYGDDEWTATFTTDAEFKAFGESAPHAICLAALRAVGVIL